MARTLIMNFLPEGTYPNFCITKKERSTVDEISTVLFSDIISENDKEELITNICPYNTRGNHGTIYEPFWDAFKKVMELNGTGSHDHRHAQFSGESSNGLVSASVANSIPDLILIAKEHLRNAAIKDYKITCESWVCLQLFPSNKFSDTAKLHSGRINIQRKIQSRNARSNHRHGHYWAILKRMWRHHINWIYLAIEKQCADFEFNTLSSLLPLPPEFDIPCFSQDDKTGIKVGGDVPVAPAVRNSLSAIVPVGTRV